MRGFKINYKGFTLVELMVVISIIAVLSAIGLTVFTGAQKNARDAKRRKDIEAIANALEAYRVPGSTTGYAALAASQFAGSVYPTDPSPQNGSTYCLASNTIVSTEVGTPSAWTTACPSAAYGTAPENVYAPISGNPGNGVKSWTICAKLETSTTGNLVTYCKQSTQ